MRFRDETGRQYRSYGDENSGRSEGGVKDMRRRFIPFYIFFWSAMFFVLLFCAPSLYRRLAAEWSGRYVAIAADYRDISSIASQSGISVAEAVTMMRKNGLLALTISEFTGKELASGVTQMNFMPLGFIDPRDRVGLDLPLNSGTLVVDSSDSMLPTLMDYMRTRMPGVVKHVPGKTTLIILPASFSDLADTGVLPDLYGFELARSTGMRIIYRPAASVSSSSETISNAFEWIKTRFSGFVCLLPTGAVVTGYPDLSPIANTLAMNHISVAQAEFVRQIGLSQLLAAVDPNLIPLHSITKDEVISRRFTRNQIVDRMIRAVHERSIRILLMRPYDMYSTGRFNAMNSDMQNIHDTLLSLGYSFAWPEPMPKMKVQLLSGIGMSIAFFTVLCSYIRRFIGAQESDVTTVAAAVFFAVAVICGLIIYSSAFAAKIMGGIIASFVAAEAVLSALDRAHRLIEGLVIGIVIIFIGGAAIAAFYGTSDAMLRLTPFSGVRLTMLLPPLLVLLSDIKNGLYPHSFHDIVKQSPSWGQLGVLGVIAVCAGVIAIRSGNSGFISDVEIQMRDILERVLWARPRTKEFLFGYPCLVIYYALERGSLFERWRPLFRIIAAVAFSSAINSFCHFHTLFPLTVIRVVNGWWLGIFLGFVIIMTVEGLFALYRRRDESEL